ncbi:MAG: gliding motility-associated C-terminal domain-containing protein [Saprospiraceae bacterium]
MGSTAGYTGQTPPGFCGTIENEQWLGFIAGAPAATFTATSSNCDIGNGVQIALYSDCNSGPLGCNGGAAGGAANPVSITVSLTPGVNYYLLIDGYAGDQCDFSINVVPPSAVQAPPVGPIGAVQGPTKICPGGDMTVMVPPVTGAGAYNWTATGGALINGQPSPVTTSAPGGNVVTITAPPNAPPPTSIQVCVQAVNSCDQDNPIVCKTIQIEKIPDTQLQPAVICAEEAPYELPWGQFVFNTGTYSNTYTSYQGCDSIVKQFVTVKPPLIKTLPPQTICAGSCITICGEEYCDGGNFSHTCTSYQGCDSIINFSILLLSPEAQIIGGGNLSCVTTSVTLTSGPSPGSKIWKVLPSQQVVGTGNSLTVTQAGTYVLTVTASAGGNLCTSTDTIVVTGNTAMPTITATNGTIGCGGATTVLNSTTNASNPTFAWTGPNGFTSTDQNPTVSASGTYTVVVTDNSTGCTNSTTATVTGNTTPPTVNTTGGTLTCSLTSLQIMASANVTGATFAWTGPSGFTSSMQNPTVTVQGTYTVVVTNPTNNCTSTATAVVALNDTPPTPTASVSGDITCPTPVVTLSATPGSGVTYDWSGPNSFTSTAQSPPANTAGTYTVTVTNNSNGCTSTATVDIAGDTMPPDASATGGTANCGSPSIVINGNSITPGATYSWTGPNGFNSGDQNPMISDIGDYILTVTDPNNSCTSTATATVIGDFTPPGAGATGGIITCSSTNTVIMGSSGTAGVTYSWVGPSGNVYPQQNPTVSNTGPYILTVTNPANGCTSTATANVDPDANVPNVSATGGTITCADTAIVLDGGSVTPGVILMWSGPGGFTSNLEDPTVSVDGTYTLTVSNPSNGCSAQAEAIVALNVDEPGATATGGTLTCTTPSFTLTGDSPTGGVSWSWTGPNMFTSSDQNPQITDDGQYTLVVTNPVNGCTSVAITDVLADQNAPVASSTTGTLTCALTSLVLNGNANQQVDYAWTGPGGFVSANQNPSVSEPGDYILTVTAVNGCTDAITVTVAQDINPPGASATGDTLDCNNPQLPISSGSPVMDVTYNWSGPGGFTSNLQNPTVSLNGSYVVTITSNANGCTSTSTAIVGIDTVTAVLLASAPDILTCSATMVNIQATVNASGSPLQNLAWTGPAGFTSSDEDPAVTDPGVYTLIATLANGCTSQIQATVNQDITEPDASAAGGTLTCAITDIDLDGGSATPGALYDWTGPNNFTSMLEDPNVNADGTYTLTVTGPNGCTSVTTAIVDLDVVPPGAAAVSSNDLDCDDLSTDLNGTSPTNGATFAWTGPNFSASTAMTTTTAPGTYIVTATGPNGCTSVDSVAVLQDITPPDAAATGDTIDCISGDALIQGNSVTTGAAYAWTGPNGFNSNQQNPTVSVNGNYVLTVTGLNGCTSTATAFVEQNTQSPQVLITGGGTLTCAIQDVTIVGSISTPGATGVWSGPGGFTSTLDTITVSQPGTYEYLVTAVNGCISQPDINIPQDIQSPQSITATGGLLNCNFPTITLQGGSTTPGVAYAWTGPGSFTSSQQNPSVTNPGTYTLVVTNPVNGCTSQTTTDVTQDPTVPDIAVTADSLTCAVQNITLNATTTTPNVTFQWTGPNNFTSTMEDPSTSAPGNYTVVATAQSGCTASFTYNLIQNITPPGASAAGDTLTCTMTTGTITGSSPTAGASFQWSGPGGFTSNLPNPSVNQTGAYTLITTGSNGCTSSVTIQVVPDASIPQLSITTGTISCDVASLQLTATSNNPNVTWSWTGPGNFNSTQQNPTITVPGNYTVVVTAQNGCSNVTSGTVIDDTQGPAVIVGTPNELNCVTLQVGLNASVPTPGSYIYQWNTADGNIISGANTQNPQVDQPGNYLVVVTNLQNGCTTTEDVDVEIDPSTPTGAVLDPRDISCFGKTDGALAINSVEGGTPPYAFSIDNQPFTQSTVFTALPPGDHILLIQDAIGCEYETSFTLTEPDELIVELGPDTTVHLGQYLSLSLDNTVNYPDRIVQTIVTPAGFLDSIFCDNCEFLPLNSFRYRLTVVDSNGCRASDDRLVIVNKKRLVYIPNIFYPESQDNNSLFMIFGGEDVELIKSFQVFDRWGALVHEYYDFLPNDISSGWDGTVRGDKATPAVFVYYAEILFKDGETILYKGDVTLYR